MKLTLLSNQVFRAHAQKDGLTSSALIKKLKNNKTSTKVLLVKGVAQTNSIQLFLKPMEDGAMGLQITSK